ncbi:hypothetical protein BGZ74_008607 [Mortierella antarctica]|nr:hypothetical protein BGZ74_008607 [Mortierella antarctica]
MKLTLSYIFAVSLLLSVSANGQIIQEPHQSIVKIDTANGQASIDTTIERHRLFRRRLHRLNRRADPVSGNEDPTSPSPSPSISTQSDTPSPSFSPPPESENPVDTTTTTTTVVPEPTSPSVVPPVTTPEATPATTTEPPVTTTTTTEPPITITTTTEPPVTTTTTDPPVTTTTTTTITTTSTTQDVTTQPPTSTSDRTTTKSKTSTSSDRGGHQSTGSVVHPTVTSNSADRPSNLPSTSGSSSNKTGITIGVVVAAIVIAGGIGVWVFRKWKLSPSRQFKSKIRNSSGGFSGGTMGAQGVGSVDHDEYDSYNDIFRPSAHDSAVPTSMPPVGSSVGSSPRQDYQQVSPQAQHISMSSTTGTVPDYSQYRYTSSAQGYDSGIPQAVLGGNTVSGGVDYYHPQNEAYISQDYSTNGRANDQFLRELRE